MKKVLSVALVFCLLFSVSAYARIFAQPQYAPGSGSTAASKPMASSGHTITSIKLNYINAEQLKETLTDLLGEGEGVSFNAALNTVIIRASDKTLNRMVSVIKKMDVAPLQVQVEAKIIEVKSGSGDETQSSKLATSWKVTNAKDANDYIQNTTTNTLTMAASSIGLYAQVFTGNTKAYLESLEKSIGYDLVASPWITALNHEKASILIGSKYGYKTSIISQTSTVQEVQFLEVGTKLNFTPHISDDGYIIMEIEPSVSEGSVAVDTGLPTQHTTETKNKVLVKDGQSIVVGGLTKNYNNQVDIGIPFLSSIPFLGALFRSTELRSEKRDIIVLITPRIVTPKLLQEMNMKAGEMEKQRQEHAEKSGLLH